MFSFTKTTISLLFLACSISAAPACEAPTQSVCSAGQTGNITAPIYYDLYAEEPDFAAPQASGWHLESYSNKSQHESLIVFPNIPTGAKSCSLKFKFADVEERVFFAKGSGADFGYAKLRQISTLPASGQNITYNSIDALDDGTGKEASNNVQNWDVPEMGRGGWTVAQFDCSAGAAFRSWLSNVSSRKEDPVDAAHVFLGADEKNGFTLSYTC